MTDDDSPHYTFGDGAVAAGRLERLSDIYRTTSQALLEEASGTLGEPPQLALDLGCGPGYTTQLVASATRAIRTVGIERSAPFLSAARQRTGPGLEFLEHDVSDSAPPCPAADLLYSRFLLTHFANPGQALASWRGWLRTGGVMVLEELEILRSPDPALSMYYELIEGLQAHHGQVMYIGPELEGRVRDAGFQILTSRARKVDVSAAEMASLHRPNLESIRSEPWVLESYDAAALDDLGRGLAAIAAESGRRTPIEDVLRQIVALV